MISNPIHPVIAEIAVKSAIESIEKERTYHIDSKKVDRVVEFVCNGMTLRQALKEVGYFE